MYLCLLCYFFFQTLPWWSVTAVVAFQHDHIALFNKRPSAAPPHTKVLSFDNQTHIVLSGDLSNTFHLHPRYSMGYVTLESNSPVKLATIHEASTDIQMDVPSWGLSRISQRQLPLTNAYGYPHQAGKGVDIYILDSGVDIHHPDLAGRVIWGANFVTGSPNRDEHGHGTIVAGIAAGLQFGVAKQATIIAVKCLAANGTGDVATIIQGLYYILQRLQTQRSRRTVINLSIVADKSEALNQAVDALSRAGAIVVVAAGNYHQEADITTRDACRYSPASASTVISVGATDESDQLATFSNDGQCVTILAPGTSILSLNTTTAVKTWYSGTSFSAPHVAGVVALVNGENNEILQQHIYSMATLNVIQNITQGTPNRLLYNGVDTCQLLPAVLPSSHASSTSCPFWVLVFIPLVLVFA